MKNKIHRLKITALTPVNIGSGSELSPYVDYITIGNYVYVIDKKKIEVLLASNDDWMNEYVDGISKGMDNNRSSFDLKIFIENKLQLNIEDVVITKSLLQTTKLYNKLSIKETIKTPLFEPYIPGSSLKGAINTIIMYEWLKQANADTPNLASRWIDDFLNLANIENKKERRDTSRLLLEELDKRAALFGEFKGHKQQRTFCDSKPFSKENILIADCSRKTPLRIECIAPNAESEIEISINKDWKDLANIINIYSYNMLSRNIELLENDETNLDAILSDMKKYEEIIDKASDDIDSTVAYLRLGFGKGFYFNSIALAVYDYCIKKNCLHIFERFLRKEYEKFKEIDKFPATFTSTDVHHQQLGWIKLELIKK